MGSFNLDNYQFLSICFFPGWTAWENKPEINKPTKLSTSAKAENLKKLSNLNYDIGK